MLKFDVAPDYLACNSVPYRPNKVPVTPQLSSPQLITQLWVTPKQLPRRNTFHNLYNLPWAVLRWRTQKQVHMLRHHFHSINLKLVPFRYSTKDLLQTLCYRTCQDELAVLGNPNKMVLEIVDSVFRTFDRTHSSYRSGLIRLRRISAFLPAASCGVSSGALL